MINLAEYIISVPAAEKRDTINEFNGCEQSPPFLYEACKYLSCLELTACESKAIIIEWNEVLKRASFRKLSEI